jgi:hypothetical protein
MPNTTGTKTVTLFHKGPLHQPIHHEFQVTTGVSVKAGQPLKLTTAGTVTPLGASDGNHLLIGYATSDAAASEYVTVVTRFRLILNAEINADSTDAGPSSYKGLSVTQVDPTFMKYGNEATAANVNAWILAPGDEFDETLVGVL